MFNQADRSLRVRRAHKYKHDPPHDALIPYLQLSGFIGVAHCSYFPVDHDLISALVERWWPETHTFHLPVGECTITLEDVSIQLGLPIDGLPVTGSTYHDWIDLCERLLGVTPPDDEMRGGGLSMSWLSSYFHTIPPGADEIVLQRHARAYILRLIGGMLFPDKSGRYVHLMYLPLLEDLTAAGQYSWGSACLAYLYRELCKATNYDTREIGGASILVQMWAWDRFPLLAPTLLDPNNYDIIEHAIDRSQFRPLGYR